MGACERLINDIINRFVDKNYIVFTVCITVQKCECAGFDFFEIFKRACFAVIHNFSVRCNGSFFRIFVSVFVYPVSNGFGRLFVYNFFDVVSVDFNRLVFALNGDCNKKVFLVCLAVFFNVCVNVES